jgi:membrane protease YdiL (CAAX protease family)
VRRHRIPKVFSPRSMNATTPSHRYPWRLFWCLFASNVFAALAVIPIALDIFTAVSSRLGPSPIPIPLVILIGAVQNLAVLALIVWLGLKLSRRLGLGAPLLESWLMKEPRSSRRWAPSLKEALLTGVVVGIVLLIGLMLLAPRLPNLPLFVLAKLPVWKRFLLCFYGGIYEELLTRLFLLSLFAWLFDRGWRKVVPSLSTRAFWLANVLAALLFGLGHLPSASLFLPITPLVVVAAILFNGIAGVAFGYLYRRRGLESAIVAHFTADFVIYVAGAALLKT